MSLLVLMPPSFQFHFSEPLSKYDLLSRSTPLLGSRLNRFAEPSGALLFRPTREPSPYTHDTSCNSSDARASARVGRPRNNNGRRRGPLRIPRRPRAAARRDRKFPCHSRSKFCASAEASAMGATIVMVWLMKIALWMPKTGIWITMEMVLEM